MCVHTCVRAAARTCVCVCACERACVRVAGLHDVSDMFMNFSLSDSAPQYAKHVQQEVRFLLPG